MTDKYYMGIAKSIKLNTLSQEKGLSHGEIIKAIGQKIDKEIKFLNLYTGEDKNNKIYRFQCQEYKGVEKENHQFRFKNIKTHDIIVLIVQDSKNKNRYHYTKYEVEDDATNEINEKTKTYKYFKDKCKEEKYFDI